MADPLRSPEDTHTSKGPGHGAPGGRPRWVVVVWIFLALALLGLIVFLHLSGVIGPGVH